MQDRIPTPGQEGRVLITPESGSPYYAKIEMADNPSQEGTPLNKSTLLQDTTAEALGLTSDAVVDDAFLALAIGTSNYAFRIHVELPNGDPVVGATISNLTDLYGGSLSTDSRGDALGVSSSESISITVSSPYIDINNKTQSLVSTGKITEVVIELDAKSETQATYTSSSTVEFSSLVDTFDVCVVGAGGGGGGGYPRYLGNSAGGGGGGYGQNVYEVSATEHKKINIVVGSGGSRGVAGVATRTGVTTPSTNGSSGGSSRVSDYSTNATIASASGGRGGYAATKSSPGSGGSGNGAGGDGGQDDTNTSGTHGGNGTFYIFGETLAGGGGGGGPSGTNWYGRGGNPDGGNGERWREFAGGIEVSSVAQSGSSPGGGGGGGGGWHGDMGAANGNGGYGANGTVYLRWYLKGGTA